MFSKLYCRYGISMPKLESENHNARYLLPGDVARDFRKHKKNELQKDEKITLNVDFPKITLPLGTVFPCY